MFFNELDVWFEPVFYSDLNVFGLQSCAKLLPTNIISNPEAILNVSNKRMLLNNFKVPVN